MNKLNFGCGEKVKEGWYNVDIIESKGINKSFDFDKFPYPLKSNQFDYVLLNQVLEHCLYPKRVLIELRRICRNGATIKIKSPYINSRSAYSNLEHCSYFNRWSFLGVNNYKFDDGIGKSKQGFIVVENNPKPQKYLMWLPKEILYFLSTFLCNILVEMNAKIIVIKEEKK